MSWWSRITNVIRRNHLISEIDEELESHIAEAIEQGRDPEEARKAFGSTLHTHEQSYDIRLYPWLDSLRADIIFGWRQLKKNRTTSAVAVLSLGLAIGACTSAFRLILVGAVAGLTFGLVSVQYIESLFYQVKATEPVILAFPSLTIVAIALLAALPPVLHALRIDPVSMLRTD